MQQAIPSRALHTLHRTDAKTPSTPSAASNVPAAGRYEALSKNLKYLTENDRLLLMDKAEPWVFTPGEPLIREGSPSKALYMLRSGTATVTRGGVELARFGAGNVCGEMTLLEASPASASVVANDQVVADAITVENLHGIFMAFPHLASRFYRSIALTLSGRLRETSQKLGQMENTAGSSKTR